jgi:hypothetical protein
MQSDQNLQGFVAVHTIRYEIWPHYDISPEGGKVIDGFDLELHGTHDHGHTRNTPGCEFCWTTYGDLRKIADAVLPTEGRLSAYEIQPFDNSLHSTAGRESEVVLTIQIKHRHEYFAPVDDCEQGCLHEMAGKLAELGVQRGRRLGW